VKLADSLPSVRSHGHTLVTGIPSQAALDHSAEEQEQEAAFGVTELDNFKVYAVCLGTLRRDLAPICLVGVSTSIYLVRHNLNFFC
jgi:hypothetical protein